MRLCRTGQKCLNWKNFVASQRSRQIKTDGDADEAIFQKLKKATLQKYKVIAIQQFIFPSQHLKEPGWKISSFKNMRQTES